MIYKRLSIRQITFSGVVILDVVLYKCGIIVSLFVILGTFVNV